MSLIMALAPPKSIEALSAQNNSLSTPAITHIVSIQPSETGA